MLLAHMPDCLTRNNGYTDMKEPVSTAPTLLRMLLLEISRPCRIEPAAVVRCQGDAGTRPVARTQRVSSWDRPRPHDRRPQGPGWPFQRPSCLTDPAAQRAHTAVVRPAPEWPKPSLPGATLHGALGCGVLRSAWRLRSVWAPPSRERIASQVLGPFRARCIACCISRYTSRSIARRNSRGA